MVSGAPKIPLSLPAASSLFSPLLFSSFLFIFSHAMRRRSTESYPHPVLQLRPPCLQEFSRKNQRIAPQLRSVCLLRLAVVKQALGIRTIAVIVATKAELRLEATFFLRYLT